MSAPQNTDLTRDELVSAGRSYRDQNLSGGDVDVEALGAALYLEEISSGYRDDHTLEDLSEYIAGTDDFNFEDFIDYKADMANDYSVFSDELGDFFDDVQRLQDQTEANSAMYQALYEEVKNERDSALRALRDIGGRAQDIGTDPGRIDDVDTTPDFDVDVPDMPDVEPGTPGTGDTDDTGNGPTGTPGTGPDGSGPGQTPGTPGSTRGFGAGWAPGAWQTQWGGFSPFAGMMGGMPGMWQMQGVTFGGGFQYDPGFWSRENIYGGSFDVEDVEGEDGGEGNEVSGDWNYEHDFFQPDEGGTFMYQSIDWD